LALAADSAGARIDDPRPHEVLVRIVGTGICQIDAYTRVLDYSPRCQSSSAREGAGVVESVGLGRRWRGSRATSPQSPFGIRGLPEL